VGHAAAAGLRQLIAELKPELYDDCIAYADHEIGNLLAALARLGLRERTAVVITADHGESLGEGGRFLHGHSLLEELVRVPLIVVLPWDEEPRRIAAPVSLLDVAPTLLDLAGLPVPPGLRGRSLFRERTESEEAAVVGVRLEAASGGQRVTDWFLRDGAWKLRVDRDSHARLFDLLSDGTEARDVAEQRPVEVGYLTARLRELGAPLEGRTAASAPQLEPAERQERERALRALGYFE
jgi:arylsulfatase A-like enzyme